MLDFTRFEIFTFDCYGTLIDREDGILGCLRPLLAAHGETVDDATILELYGEFEARSELGESRIYREILNTVVRKFGEEFNFLPSAEEIASLAGSLRHWWSWPDTVTALQEFRKRFRLSVISNVDDDLFAATLPQLGVDSTRV